jgi:hypothetical protein
MKNRLAAVALVVLGAAIGLHASDRVGVYAVIDKVVFEPNAANPERIRVWGAFAVATRNDRNLYDDVRRGYLYFSAVESRELARREWKDLKALAGSKRVAAFGSRFGQSVRVRAEHEPPQQPDEYVVGIGVRAIRPESVADYAPIKALSAHLNR